MIERTHRDNHARTLSARAAGFATRACRSARRIPRLCRRRRIAARTDARDSRRRIAGGWCRFRACTASISGATERGDRQLDDAAGSRAGDRGQPRLRRGRDRRRVARDGPASPHGWCCAGFSQGVAMGFRAAAATHRAGRRRHRRRRRRAAGDRRRGARPRADGARLPRRDATSGIRTTKFEHDITPPARSPAWRCTPLAFDGGHEWSDEVVLQPRHVSSRARGVSDDARFEARRPADARALAELRWEFRAGGSRRPRRTMRLSKRCAAWMRRSSRRGAWRAWVAVARRRASSVRSGCIRCQKFPIPSTSSSNTPTCRISTSSRRRAAASARDCFDTALDWAAIERHRSRRAVAVAAKRHAVSTPRLLARRRRHGAERHRPKLDDDALNARRTPRPGRRILSRQLERMIAAAPRRAAPAAAAACRRSARVRPACRTRRGCPARTASAGATAGRCLSRRSVGRRAGAAG